MFAALVLSLAACSDKPEGTGTQSRSPDVEKGQGMVLLRGLPTLGTRHSVAIVELDPEAANFGAIVQDFELPDLGKVAPYGVYDLAANAGWVNVGVDADTAAFAVESIRRWWQQLGQTRYPDAKRLIITADCGGSNGARVRLWKRELQRFANETGLAVTVAHLPPGTSKWNRWSAIRSSCS